MKKSRLLGAVCACIISITAFKSVHAGPVIWVDDSSGNLGTVDVATGNVNVIGNMGAVMTDIAFDPNGNLFGIDFTTLYSINSATAVATPIGATGTSLNSLIFNSDGTLYSALSALYTIDTVTGVASLVGSGGDSYFSSGDLAFINGELYLTNLDATTGLDTLFQLDKTTGVGTNIGNIGFPSVYGLATNNNIDLFGVSGTEILSIDTATGNGSLITDFSGQGLGFTNGSAFLGEAAVVPIPAALWLFGSGLLSLVGMARCKKA